MSDKEKQKIDNVAEPEEGSESQSKGARRLSLGRLVVPALLKRGAAPEGAIGMEKPWPVRMVKVGPGARVEVSSEHFVAKVGPGERVEVSEHSVAKY